MIYVHVAMTPAGCFISDEAEKSTHIPKIPSSSSSSDRTSELTMSSEHVQSSSNHLTQLRSHFNGNIFNGCNNFYR